MTSPEPPSHVRPAAFCLSVLFLCLLAGIAHAVEISDSTFGFRVQVPEEYIRLEAGAEEPDTLYKYVHHMPSPENPSVVIQVQRLRGVIDPEARLNAADFPPTKNVKVTLQTITWKGLELDVMRHELGMIPGMDYVVYGVQYPLSGEAIQFQVGGPIAQDKEVQALFTRLAQGFENASPLYRKPEDSSGAKPSPNENMQGLGLAIFAVAGTLLGAFLIVRLLPGRTVKPKPKSEG